MNPEAPFYPHKVRANPERAFRKALFEDRLTDDDRRLIEEYIAGPKPSATSMPTAFSRPSTI